MPFSATITNNLRFPGQYLDAETGLHYNYFRYYDPEIGRYLRIDPIGINGGLNLFRYGRNNPLTHMDVRGLNNTPGWVREWMNNQTPYTTTVSDDIGYWQEPIPPIFDDLGIYPEVESHLKKR